MEKRFLTKPSGHRISQFYTIIFLSAIGFAIFPDNLLKGPTKFFWGPAVIAVAVILTYLPRIIRMSGVSRVTIDKENVTIGLIQLPLDRIIRLLKVNRTGIFGPELQVWTDAVRPMAVVALGELQDPEGMVQALKEAAPAAGYMETQSGLNFLDWGLFICLAGLIWVIIWRMFL